MEDGRDILVYVGPSAKRIEKLKAISAANQIRDQDHNGRANVQILGVKNSFVYISILLRCYFLYLYDSIDINKKN